MIQFYDIAENFDASAGLNDILNLLPQWRRQQALSYRQDIDRFLCAKSYLMLEGLLREHFGIDRCPEFSYGSHGKPYFPNHPGIFFNISHCHRGIACAVLSSPVGIDIEEIQYDYGLASVIFNPKELALISKSDEPELKFTELWTLKESFLKLTGEGIKDNMKDVLLKTEGVSFKTEVKRDSGYAYSIAIATKQQNYVL